MTEAAAIGEEQPGDRSIGRDAGDLDQAWSDVHADGERLQPAPDRADQPQDVHVARWVVGQPALAVEGAGPGCGQPIGPDREVANVDPEAAQRQVQPRHDKTQDDSGHDQGGHQGRRLERHAALEWPCAPLPYGVAGHRWRHLVIGAGWCRTPRWARVYIGLLTAPEGWWLR